MKKTLLLLLSGSFCLSISGQITRENNSVRNGDEIIKQQMQYKDPGRSGENVIWDFSMLKAVNPKYKLTFRAPELINDSIYIMGRDTLLKKDSDINHLIIGEEHSTMYYYQIKGDTMFCLGHENPVTLMHHKMPLPLMVFPFNYKRKIEQKFESEGLHTSLKRTNTYGNISVESDAYGKMILPSGDTLNNILRIKTVQIINDTSNIKKNKPSPGDIVKILLSRQQKQNPVKCHKQIEANTYSWYAKGYRYPIFETVQAFEVVDSLKNETFTTAYFYPPIDHYYLDDDPENLAVLDSLNNNKTDTNTSWISKNFSYNYWPNPVSTTLNIEYKLEDEAIVAITLYSSVYGVVKVIAPKHRETGLYKEAIDCSVLFPGAYIIKFDVRNESVSNIVLKK